MGKAAMFIIISALIGGSLLLYQSEQTAFETFRDQSERQEEIIAREIARSGYSAIRAKVREVEQELYEFNSQIPLSQLIVQVNDGSASNRPEHDYEGGSYTVWIQRVGVDAYRMHSIGRYGDAEHEITGTSLISSMGTAPEDNPPLGGGITDDLEGECGALFMQEHMPITDSGIGGYEEDEYTNPLNPSHGEGDDYEQRSARYMRLDPKMVFPSGNGDTNPRDATIANIMTELPAGTRLGFVLAIDEDCSLAGNWDAPFSEFDAHYYSIVAHQAGRTGREGSARAGGQGTVGDLEEGNNVLLEQNADEDYLWRVAFEADQNWSSTELLDAKDALSDESVNSLTGWVDLDPNAEGPTFTDFIVEFWMTSEYDLAQHSPGHTEMDVCLLGDGCTEE